MVSIPKLPMRGNGPDPRPSGYAHPHRPERQPPLPGSSPWDAIACLERIRELADDMFGPWGADYSVASDIEYQVLRARLSRLIDHPCFADAVWPMLDVLPPSLGTWATLDGFMWLDNVGGRSSLVGLQGELLTALIDAGIPQPLTQQPDPTPMTPALQPDQDAETSPLALPKHVPQSATTRPPSAATRYKEERMAVVRELHAQGMTREAMRFELKRRGLGSVELRTIDNYLKEIRASEPQ